jgi:hypothetical protein
MATDWLPTETQKRLYTKAAHDGERLHVRFRWDQPDPGGWIHDVLVFHDGAWRQFADPSPWVSDDPDHAGFYEDRLSFLLDDGSVRGFAAFGGWLTAHEGMRSLPSEAPPEAVRAHPHYGDDGLGRTDIRKYLPQACAGEWWESDWRNVRPQAELDALKRRGVFLDLPMWRAHRSDPLGYGTDHHVLDYRHSDAGRNTYGTQSWDPETGPEYMFDPAVVDDGALDYHALRDGDVPPQSATYALTPDVTVPFDPDVAEWEGAAIPRRPLREPHGSAADWLASGTWADGEWTVEMSRALSTDHPLDTTQLTPGETYDWAPAIHHGAGTRFHWVGYPRTLGLGVDPPARDDAPPPLVARAFDGEIDWDAVPWDESTLVFPGVQSWTDLVSDDNPHHEAVRALETTMYALRETRN